MNFLNKIPYVIKGVKIGLLIVIIEAVLFIGCVFGLSGEGKITCNFVAGPVFMLSFSGLNIVKPPPIPSYTPTMAKERGVGSVYMENGTRYISCDDTNFFKLKNLYDKNLKYFYFKLIFVYVLLVSIVGGLIGLIVQVKKDRKKREVNAKNN